jgi:D-alanyl-D-alanine carboxypeptidase
MLWHILMGWLMPQAGSAQPLSPAVRTPNAALKRALEELVAMPGGPPGAIALVQRGGSLTVHAAGVRALGSPEQPQPQDAMRVASVAKAFNGATALALVDAGLLLLNDSIGQWLPDLPVAWHAVNLRKLLSHTSGLPDITQSPTFRQAVTDSPLVAPAPSALLAFVKDQPLNFPPGTQYRYSNSANIAVGLMIEAATRQPYTDVLKARVLDPLRIDRTSLPPGPELVEPFIHGNDVLEDGAFGDVSEILAAGWAWASGGILSTPANPNRFVRGYVRGRLYRPRLRTEQRRWIPGAHSEPPGPGWNSVGLGLYRYQNRCGTVYGQPATPSATPSSRRQQRTGHGRSRYRSRCNGPRTAKLGLRPSSRRYSGPRSRPCVPRWRGDVNG